MPTTVVTAELAIPSVQRMKRKMKARLKITALAICMTYACHCSAQSLGMPFDAELEARKLDELARIEAMKRVACAISESDRASPDFSRPLRTVVFSKPGMPAEARAVKGKASVVALFEIGVDGLVHEVNIISSSSAVFSEAVRKNARSWVFCPVISHGVPVPVFARQDYEFQVTD
jgi:hypothetical protein